VDYNYVITDVIIIIISYHVLYSIVDYMLPRTSCAFSKEYEDTGIHNIHRKALVIHNILSRKVESINSH